MFVVRMRQNPELRLSIDIRIVGDGRVRTFYLVLPENTFGTPQPLLKNQQPCNS